VGISKGRNLLEDLGEDGTILLKLLLRKYGVRAWTGKIYSGVGSQDVLDRTMTLMSSKDGGELLVNRAGVVCRKGGLPFFFFFFFFL